MRSELSYVAGIGTIMLLVMAVGCQAAQSCDPVKWSYPINHDRIALRLGCFHSNKQAGVFPMTDWVSLRHQIDWDLWNRVGHAGDIIKKCGELAIQKGVQFFGVEFYGECFFGEFPDISQGEVTPADGCDMHCEWDVGGPYAMVVYNVGFVDRFEDLDG